MRWMGPLDPPIPDFDQATLLNVSGRAKAFIERIEPGVHQFVPVDYFDKNDKFFEKRYFWVICNRIDSVDRQHTTFILRKGKVWRSATTLFRRGELQEIPSHIDPSQPGKLVYNLPAIGNAQVWRDMHQDGAFILTSDHFAEELRASGLTGFQLSNKLEAI